MKTLIDEYKAVVERTVDLACKLQTGVAIVAGPLIWLLTEYLSPVLGRVSVVLLLLSIPSVAWWAKHRIRKYEHGGWQRRHPSLNFGGTWDIHVKFLHALKIQAQTTLPPEQEGQVSIEQTPFGLTQKSSCLVSKNSRDELGGWKWLAANVSDDGRSVFAAYQMDELPNASLKNKRSHGHGFQEITVTEWEQGFTLGRPKTMHAFWYDCIRDDANDLIYIGETTLRRRS